ncbi:MAG: potassium transporter Kup [Caldilineaceae bacterium]|nr:potassium transporter Kup [Caldilineaceae bacterium]
MHGSQRTQEQTATESNHHTPPVGRHLFHLSLGALGVVYGDIGTSTLYAFRESFHHSHGIEPLAANILGILSLIFWALIIIISVKYLIFVMQADNEGEGGILALTALIRPPRVQRYTRQWLLILLGLFGTALLYGDGMITPAISVLSAVEGLEIATPFFAPYVVPITIVILVVLFLFQSRGTERVGKVFGPLMLLWFGVSGLLGLSWIIRQPGVLAAVNPWYGAQFFIHNGWRGFLVLGSVFLVVTGGEALYADMGHFGKRPIRLAWFAVVLPALLLNYFGQGALLLQHPEAVINPFYRMAPSWALLPVVVLATMATVIASQALITGAFSLTKQAVQLVYLPRTAIEHTSPEEIGQVYIPSVNWILMVSCIALVLAFRTSSNLAAAYGVAVTTTMVVTTLLLFSVARNLWKWSLPVSLLFAGFFLLVDVAFWGANLVKIPHGGWFPLVIGAIVFTLMTTWHRGREILADRLRVGTLRFEDFAKQVHRKQYARVPGTAIYMYSDPTGTPPALLQNLEHNKVLHQAVVLLSVQTEDIPKVPANRRIQYEKLENGFHRVILCYGFMQVPNVPYGLELLPSSVLALDPQKASYFLGRERLLASEHPGMALWREQLFALMVRNSRPATDFFRLPVDRVVELGSHVEI